MGIMKNAPELAHLCERVSAGTRCQNWCTWPTSPSR